MVKRERRSGAEIAEALAALAGWTQSDDGTSLRKSYTFKTFVEAFGFMTECALAAEKLDHHPEWFNVYNRVDVVLTTHSAGGLTDLDFALAQRMETAASTRTL